MGLSVPQSKVVEKQITGQIEISDYLADWEDKKRRQSEAQKQALEKRINDSTGPIFAGYDERMRNNMINELDREQKLFADKYRADDIQFRSIDEVIGKKTEPKATLQKVTPLPEIREAVDKTETDGEEYRSIWDEVHEAIEADHEKQQGVSQTTGLIDAAVEQANRLAVTDAAPEKAEEEKDKDNEEKSIEDTGKLGGYEEGFFDGEVDEDTDTSLLNEEFEERLESELADKENDAESSAEEEESAAEAEEDRFQIRRMTIGDYDRVYALWLSTKGMGLKRSPVKSMTKRFMRKALTGSITRTVNTKTSITRTEIISRTNTPKKTGNITKKRKSPIRMRMKWTVNM